MGVQNGDIIASLRLVVSQWSSFGLLPETANFDQSDLHVIVRLRTNYLQIALALGPDVPKLWGGFFFLDSPQFISFREFSSSGLGASAWALCTPRRVC